MAPTGCSGRHLHVRAKMRKSTRLIRIVGAGDGEHGQRESRIFLAGRVVAIPIRIALRVRHPFLKKRGRSSDESIELPEWRTRLVMLLELCRPELLSDEHL